MYNTRIAPSPTGMMHVGTARTAIFNWLTARSTNGKFIIRIDDTDQERHKEEAIKPIFDGLAWLGLDHDAVYHQSDRLNVYNTYADMLLEHSLARRADNGAILLNLPDDLPISWHDEVVGEVTISSHDVKLIRDLPLIRGGDKQGAPTYNFASIVDDYLLDINYIIRGVDHIANTSKQIAVWIALQKIPTSIGNVHNHPRTLPKFAHVGLIFYQGKRMSKREGAASLLDYRDKGYDPEAVFAFLTRLGWGPTIDNKTTALVTRDMALRMFLNEGSMRSTNAGFDPVRLDSVNRKITARKQKIISTS